MLLNLDALKLAEANGKEYLSGDLIFKSKTSCPERQKNTIFAVR